MMSLRQMTRSAREGTTVCLRNVGQGLLAAGQKALALFGLAVALAAVFAIGHADLRERAEVQALDWLQVREALRAEAQGNLIAALAEPSAVERATAVDPAALDRQQARVAHWLSRRYRVAPEPLSRLVKEAWTLGERAGIDPTLILAVAAIESSFNPFAQSTAGAQGLMQVMTRVHTERFEPFGGSHAAFDPVTNLRVGVQILAENLRRTGDIETALRWYVGAANLPSDGGYVARVLGERYKILQVAQGRALSPHTPLRPLPVAARAPAAAQDADAPPAPPEAQPAGLPADPPLPLAQPAEAATATAGWVRVAMH
jgi:soluble lytic murein transglycosylase-like protein